MEFLLRNGLFCKISFKKSANFVDINAVTMLFEVAIACAALCDFFL